MGDATLAPTSLGAVGVEAFSLLGDFRVRGVFAGAGVGVVSGAGAGVVSGAGVGDGLGGAFGVLRPPRGGGAFFAAGFAAGAAGAAGVVAAGAADDGGTSGGRGLGGLLNSRCGKVPSLISFRTPFMMSGTSSGGCPRKR